MAFIDPRYYNQETAQYEMMRAQNQLMREHYNSIGLAQASSQAAQLGMVAQQHTPTPLKTLLLLGD